MQTMDDQPKYPKVKLSADLTGNEGNVFYILGMTRRALFDAGVSKTEVDQYMREATADDYVTLLEVTEGWVSCTWT